MQWSRGYPGSSTVTEGERGRDRVEGSQSVSDTSAKLKGGGGVNKQTLTHHQTQHNKTHLSCGCGVAICNGLQLNKTAYDDIITEGNKYTRNQNIPKIIKIC